jgi:6-phospho-3-hexuloisomerase
MEGIPDEAAESLITEILASRRIILYGTGREGLMVKALTMRLYHLGLDVHYIGDMTTPPGGEGDLFIVAAGPGGSTTVLALLDAAKGEGVRTLAVSAQPQGNAAQRADVFVHLPAQTMADDQGQTVSVLPMGSLFEIALLIFFDLVVVQLRERLGQSSDEMRARHTNLE